MPPVIKNDIRREVLRYFRKQATPVGMSILAQGLRSQNQKLSRLQDEDFLAVVQPMIVTGKLSYAPGLKIRVGKIPGVKIRLAKVTA